MKHHLSKKVIVELSKIGSEATISLIDARKEISKKKEKEE